MVADSVMLCINLSLALLPLDCPRISSQRAESAVFYFQERCESVIAANAEAIKRAATTAVSDYCEEI
jgi:hypothetical protein